MPEVPFTKNALMKAIKKGHVEADAIGIPPFSRDLYPAIRSNRSVAIF